MTEFKKTNWWVSLFGRHNKALDSAEVLNYNSNMKNYSYIKHFSVVLNLIQHLKHKRFRNKFGMICGTICHPELVSVSKLKSFKAFQKLAAFTLAEVLITLAIVGIVAAMTIPTLVSKIQERQFHVKWKECYAILNNAFKLTVAENPKMVASELNNYDPTREFIEEILKHVHVVDTCGVSKDFDNNICDNYAHYKDYQIKYKWSGVANIYSRYTTLAGGKLNAYDFNKKAVLLKNGASIYFGGLWSGLTIVVDVNNFNGGPNVIGKDVYAISMTKSGNYYNVQYIEDLYFRPYGAEGTQTEIRGYQDCAADIGKTSGSSVDALYEAPGAGCSFKYLNEK